MGYIFLFFLTLLVDCSDVGGFCELNRRTINVLYPPVVISSSKLNPIDSILDYLSIDPIHLEQDLSTIYKFVSVSESIPSARNAKTKLYEGELMEILDKIHSLTIFDIESLRRALTSHGVIASHLLCNYEQLLLKKVISVLTNKYYQYFIDKMPSNTVRDDMIVYKLEEFIKINPTASYIEHFLYTDYQADCPYFYSLLELLYDSKLNDWIYTSSQAYTPNQISLVKKPMMNAFLSFLDRIRLLHISKLPRKGDVFDMLSMIENWEREKDFKLENHKDWNNVLGGYVIYGSLFGPLPRISPKTRWHGIVRTFLKHTLQLLKHVEAHRKRMTCFTISRRIELLFFEML